jgi:hypothetical protein
MTHTENDTRKWPPEPMSEEPDDHGFTYTIHSDFNKLLRERAELLAALKDQHEHHWPVDDSCVVCNLIARAEGRDE